MIAEIGLIALALATLATLYALGAAFIGARRGQRGALLVESARNAALVAFALLSLASLIIVYLLVTNDFSVHYVWEVSSRAMSPFLRVTALWGGQSGSLLFWSWLMSGFMAAVLARKWHENRDLMPWVIVVTAGTLFFFEILSLVISNPFIRLWQLPNGNVLDNRLFAPVGAVLLHPQDGQGLNPLLRHFGMIGHPPATYLGFTGFVIPYAFAMAALITRRSVDSAWIATTRRWTLIAWAFLGVGLFLGGRWAYDVLGWGGYWGWDPVENAMLMPWLTATAFLHSVMIQERRGMLKVWNMVLIIVTYSLVMFGTFITRSGVIGSVHAFSKSAIGPLFFVFIATTFAGSAYLLWRSWDTLKSENETESMFSRETAFLLQNVLFLAITFVTLWGTIFPMISELIVGDKITVGPPYFEKANLPLVLALVLLMGIGPVMAWRKQDPARFARLIWLPALISLVATGALAAAGIRQPPALVGIWIAGFTSAVTFLEYWHATRATQAVHRLSLPAAFWQTVLHNRRRYGGYLVHLGIVILAFGVIGSKGYQQEAEAFLAKGQTMQVGVYTLRYDSLRQYDAPDDRQVTEATVSIMREGRTLATVTPHRDLFYSNQQTSTIAGVLSTPITDVYVLLAGWQDATGAPQGSAATFKVYVNPMVNWVWFGGILLTLGTFFAAWPTAARQRRWVMAAASAHTEPIAG
jgi:cytochrome c-type biogenesis protein CcmF